MEQAPRKSSAWDRHSKAAPKQLRVMVGQTPMRRKNPDIWCQGRVLMSASRSPLLYNQQRVRAGVAPGCVTSIHCCSNQGLPASSWQTKQWTTLSEWQTNTGAAWLTTDEISTKMSSRCMWDWWFCLVSTAPKVNQHSATVAKKADRQSSGLCFHISIKKVKQINIWHFYSTLM